jgi:hypothetical protein
LSQFPDQEFTVICLSNCDDIVPWTINSRIADLVLGVRLQPQVARTPSPVASDGRIITLRRNESGQVNGLSIDYFRVKGVWFAKR